MLDSCTLLWFTNKINLHKVEHTLTQNTTHTHTYTVHSFRQDILHQPKTQLLCMSGLVAPGTGHFARRYWHPLTEDFPSLRSWMAHCLLPCLISLLCCCWLCWVVPLVGHCRIHWLGPLVGCWRHCWVAQSMGYGCRWFLPLVWCFPLAGRIPGLGPLVDACIPCFVLVPLGLCLQLWLGCFPLAGRIPGLVPLVGACTLCFGLVPLVGCWHVWVGCFPLAVAGEIRLLGQLVDDCTLCCGPVPLGVCWHFETWCCPLVVHDGGQKLQDWLYQTFCNHLSSCMHQWS